MTELLDQGAAAIPRVIENRAVGLQVVTPRLHDRPLPAMAQRTEAVPA